MHGSGEIEDIPFPEDLNCKYQKFTEAGLENLRKAGYSKDFMPIEEGVRQYYDHLISSNGIYI